MHKILVCNNLMGDSVYMLKPLDAYLAAFPGECVALTVLSGFGGDIIRSHFQGRIPIYSSQEEALVQFPEADVLLLPAGRAMEIAVEAHKKLKHPIHISEAFAFMLGVDIKEDIKPPTEWVPVLAKPGNKIAVISPFSRSCTRHSGLVPNKTLDDWKWEGIIRYLRKHDYIVHCVGAPDDILSLVSLPLSSYRSAETLDDVFRQIQEADLVISVDCGTIHIAALCGTPTVVFWSGFKGVPPQFIAPLYAPNVSYVMIGNPNETQPATLLYGMKKVLEKFAAEKLI
jgi:hypothetical protein